MFAAPPCIEAEIFTVIPEKFSRAADRSEWVDVQFAGAPTASFLEGPAFDAQGNLWVTDIPWGRFFKITPGGEVSIGAEYDGEPNGLKFLDDGRGIVACHKHGLVVLDPETGTVEPYITNFRLEPFKGANDLCIARNGDLYFTDQGQTGLHDPSGRLYRLTAAGKLEILLTNIPSPNGLVLNKAENILYLAVTRANAVWKVPLMPDGGVSKVGVFVQLSGGTSGPDGLAIDDEDNLVVCHNGFGAVWVFSAVVGEPILRINAPKSLPQRGIYTTNCAFGGPDNKTLFITESKTGTILTAPMPAPGRALYSRTL